MPGWDRALCISRNSLVCFLYLGKKVTSSPKDLCLPRVLLGVGYLCIENAAKQTYRLQQSSLSIYLLLKMTLCTLFHTAM